MNIQRRATLAYKFKRHDGVEDESGYPVMVHDVCGPFSFVEAMDLIAVYQPIEQWMVGAQRGQMLKVPTEAIRFVDF